METRTCRWPDCKKAAKARGLCSRCYYRASQVGSFDDPWTLWAEKLESEKTPRCRWPECVGKSVAHTLCSLHYQRAKVLGNYETPWTEWGIGVCVMCGTEFAGTRNATADTCSARCRGNYWLSRNPDKRRLYSQKRRTRTALGELSEDQVVALREQTFDCYLCGQQLDFTTPRFDPYSVHLDHIIPLNRGGEHSISNLAYTHAWCNLLKGARTPDELHDWLYGQVEYMFT